MSGTSKVSTKVDLRLPNDIAAKLKQMAADQGVTFSELVRPSLLKLARQKNGKRGVK